jgi:hypothetical protein
MNLNNVNFYGNNVEVVKDEKGEIWVSVRSICEGIGVDWKSQWAKLSSDQKFNCGDITSVARDGRQREMVCLPLNQLNGWLFSINANKVREDVKHKLLQYQQECMDVLYNHFMPNGATDLSALLDRFDLLDKKMDGMIGVSETVFGDDQKEIQDLVAAVARVHGVDGRTVWGWVQTECDVSSYKKQNLKVKNYLRNKLGSGVLGVVKEEE